MVLDIRRLGYSLLLIKKYYNPNAASTLVSLYFFITLARVDTRTNTRTNTRSSPFLPISLPLGRIAFSYYWKSLGSVFNATEWKEALVRANSRACQALASHAARDMQMTGRLMLAFSLSISATPCICAHVREAAAGAGARVCTRLPKKIDYTTALTPRFLSPYFLSFSRTLSIRSPSKIPPIYVP
jgi:hypothetical protein